MILDQHCKKLENVTAEWASKADHLHEGFAGVCANARNEAELCLLKLDDYTSDVYTMNQPVGLNNAMAITPIAGWHPGIRANLLRYLQVDMQILPGRLSTEDHPIPGLPGPRSMQVVLKLPLDPVDRDRIHAGCTQNLLASPLALLTFLKGNALPIEFGIINTRSNLYDTSLFDKEHKKLYFECLFYSMKAVLYRDYVGDDVIHDAHTRLQRCKQAMFVQNKPVVLRVADFYSKFMMIVHEFDPKQGIPCNLAQIMFHNLTKKVQDKLLADHYKPPQEMGPPQQQYEQLSHLRAEAIKVEKELDTIAETVRTVSGVKRPNPSTR